MLLAKTDMRQLASEDQRAEVRLGPQADHKGEVLGDKRQRFPWGTVDSGSGLKVISRRAGDDPVVQWLRLHTTKKEA